MDYDKYDAFLHHIFKQTQGDAWFRPSEENLSAGVCIRTGEGEFFFFFFHTPSHSRNMFTDHNVTHSQANSEYSRMKISSSRRLRRRCALSTWQSR